jgi:ribose-phosphate pyrophosphokinase
MKILSCNSNPTIAKKISEYLNIDLIDANITKFADKEIFVEVNENVRGEDIFVIQSTQYPANDNIMELLITIDALKRASAKRITAVIPYFGYARQDRKSSPRTPISAKLVANLITIAGAHRVLTLDLHATQIQGFFDIPLDNLIAAPVFTRHIKNKFPDNEKNIIVSPDVGGLVRARVVAKKLNCDLAIVDKRRPKAGVSKVMNIIGNVEGRHCIMVDDIVDSGGTLCNAASALLEKGASQVSAYITHGVLANNAYERITESNLSNLIITDSIEQFGKDKNHPKIQIISIASLIADAINRISEEKSVSILFD